jgi:c-di-GMP-binding flagellar brake protein YcgR
VKRPRTPPPPEIKGTARAQLDARLLDLSQGGVLLHLGVALEVGGIYDFALQLDGETVWTQGEVLRSRPSERGGFQVAVEFVGIAPHHRRQLEQYLHGRA